MFASGGTYFSLPFLGEVEKAAAFFGKEIWPACDYWDNSRLDAILAGN
jgi:hypothetical protein